MSEDLQLRPKSLNEIIGQEKVKAQLKIEIEGAKFRDEALGHVLLMGRPGLGKTTFAQAIAFELEKPIIYAEGPTLDKSGVRDIVQRHLAPGKEHAEIFESLGISPKEGGVVLSDEVHAIPKTAFESVYTLMEDFAFEGEEIKPFTFIGATTDPGMLPLAFRSRFIIPVTIDYYDDESLQTILIRSYEVLEGKKPTDATVSALGTIAQRSRGTPRLANNLLRRVRNVQSFQKEDEITPEVLKQSMMMMGIDIFGLDQMDRRVLLALEELDRPVSIAAVAAKMGESKDTIEQINEPWLVRKNYVERGQRGRRLTAEGRDVVNILRRFGGEEDKLF